MPRLIMLKGLPASGKSTWANDTVLANPAGKVVRVNKDTLREMLHAGRWKGKKTESQIIDARDVLVRLFLLSGKDVIVDDTNLVPRHEASLREIAEQVGAEFEINNRFLSVPLDVCLERDLKRPNSVGEKVIRSMYDKYVAPPSPAPSWVSGRPSAVIVDLDGTLAHMRGRSPYDFSRVLEDSLDTTINALVTSARSAGHTILVVSGRDDSCLPDTCEWLQRQGVQYDRLLMRKTGDKRPDYVVKKEIYNEEIKDHYNIQFVLDDRNSVVQMWRSLGLKCLQVAPGDF